MIAPWNIEIGFSFFSDLILLLVTFDFWLTQVIFWLPDSQFFISEVSVNTVMYAAQGIRFIFTQIPLSYTQKESG